MEGGRERKKEGRRGQVGQQAGTLPWHLLLATGETLLVSGPLTLPLSGLPQNPPCCRALAVYRALRTPQLFVTPTTPASSSPITSQC